MVLPLRGWRGPGWCRPGEVGEAVAVIVDVGNDGQSMAMVVCGEWLGGSVGVGPKSRFADTKDIVVYQIGYSKSPKRYNLWKAEYWSGAGGRWRFRHRANIGSGMAANEFGYPAYYQQKKQRTLQLCPASAFTATQAEACPYIRSNEPGTPTPPDATTAHTKRLLREPRGKHGYHY